LPQGLNFKIGDFIDQFKAKKVELGFRYNSGENDQWVSVEQLRKLIKDHVDPTFTI
jgi:hypothetical protein